MNTNFQKKLSEKDALNEILFANRNKEYGAYVLRNQANVFLQRAMFIGVSLFTTVVLVPIIISNFTPKAHYFPTSGPVILENIPKDPIIPDKPETIQSKTIENVKTNSLTTPEPTKTPENQVTISPKVTDATIALVTDQGTPVTIPTYNPTVSQSEGTTPKPAENTFDSSKIENMVDVEASFGGGVNAFREKVTQGFDSSEFQESGETIKTTVTFVVERDGSISNIKTEGNNSDFNKEAERTVKSIKSKWTPAKLKGNFVRSYFRIPISMRFE